MVSFSALNPHRRRSGPNLAVNAWSSTKIEEGRGEYEVLVEASERASRSQLWISDRAWRWLLQNGLCVGQCFF